MRPSEANDRDAMLALTDTSDRDALRAMALTIADATLARVPPAHATRAAAQALRDRVAADGLDGDALADLAAALHAQAERHRQDEDLYWALHALMRLGEADERDAPIKRLRHGCSGLAHLTSYAHVLQLLLACPASTPASTLAGAVDGGPE